MIDASALNAAVAEGIKFSSRSPAQNINTAAIAVLRRVIEITPFVSQQTIDSELGTAVVLQRKKRGKGFRTAKRTQIVKGGKLGDVVTTVPLTVLIMLARRNPDSNYNRRTHNRWKLPPNAFKGKGGGAAMSQAINRMIKARHSSSKFLISGWVAALDQLRGKAYASEPVIDVSASVHVEIDHGRATPAQEGSTAAVCVIENLIGLGGSLNAQNYNRALLEHGTHPLQIAIAEIAEDKIRHIGEKQIENDLAPKWNAAMR